MQKSDTKFPSTEFHNSITCNTVKQMVDKWIKKFMKPRRVVSDNGRQYTGNIFKNYMSKKLKQILCHHTRLAQTAFSNK